MAYPTMSISVPWSLVQSGFHKSPSTNTVIQRTAARRGTAAFSLTPYPTWAFEVDLAFVAGGEAVAGSVLQSFLGTHMACLGGAQLFIFTDPNDNTVSHVEGCMLNQTPGAAAPQGQAGDGSSTIFQLGRNIGQGVDLIQNASSVQVKVNGSVKALGTDYSISATGVVAFVAAPPNAATITWSGSFQYLCRFTEDTLSDLARVSKNSAGFLWSCSSIKFESEFVA